MAYCQYRNYPVKFSVFKRLSRKRKKEIRSNLNKKFIKIVAYSLLPNHFHLILRQETNNGISCFINRLLTSYTKFFNTKNNRSGPLFEGRFKAILVETDKQLLHLVRYILLNPYSSNIVRKPVDLLSYPWSSFSEHYKKHKSLSLCDGEQIFISQFRNREKLKKFVLDHADYQKNLGKIKHLIIE